MIQYRRVLEVRAFTAAERRLYDVWQSIRQRCKNPNSQFYADYGGRGISICKEWDEDFAAFASHVGFPPARGYDLDRRDNNGNYEPGNVRWITHQDNNKNTRHNRPITINGVTKLMCEWCDEYGIQRPTMFRRLALGWEGEKLLSSPESSGWGEKLTINGISKTIPEWANHVGISVVGFRSRIQQGYTGEQLLKPTAKLRSRHRKSATPPLTS